MSSDEQAKEVAWYIKDANGLTGPFSESNIREKFRQGKIDDLASIRQGNSSWRLASEVQKLFEELEQSGWYFQYSIHTLGPYTPQRLLALIETGRVPKGSTIRCGSEASWISVDAAISLLREAIAKLPKANPVEPLGTSAKKAVSDPLGKSRLRKVADQVGLRAQLKSIQMLELPKANWNLGLRAFEFLIGHDKLRKNYVAIEATDKAILLARQPIEKVATETMTDKATRMALEAKRRLEIEGLQMTRRAKIIELGEAIADDPKLDSENELRDLIATVQRLRGTKLEIEAKLEQLQSHGWAWRRGLVMVGLIAMVLVAGYWYFRPLTASERLERAIARSQQLVLAEQQAEWEEEEEALRESELEAELATAKAAAEMERLQNEIQRRRERSEQSKSREGLDEAYLQATAKLESELRSLELEEKERLRADKLRQQKRSERLATQQSLEDAQKSLRELCGSLFEDIDLRPMRSVAISKRLMENGVEVELRGTDIERIRKCLDEEDWLSLINLLLQVEHVELPDANQIREAAEQLRKHNFQILVKSNSPVIRQSVNRPELGRVLASVSVDIQGGLEKMKLKVDSKWEQHPDGIGFVQPWSPQSGRTVIAVLPQTEIDKKCSEFQSLVANRLKYFDEKSKLGEISSDMLPARKVEEVRALRDRVMAWALVRTEEGNLPASDQQETTASLFSLPKRGKYECTIVDAKTGQQRKPEYLIFSEDVVGLVSGKSGDEVSHLWIRHRSHPIETLGLYVYRLAEEVENGILVVQSFNGSGIVVSSFVGSELDTVEVLRNKALSAKASDIWGHWINGSHQIDGVENPPKKSSLPRTWRDLLRQHAPSCLINSSKNGR